MNSIEAVLLGLVQGLTEFFPISSSAHLLMIQYLLGDEEQKDLVFEIAVHIATLIAITYAYRRRITDLIAGFLAGRSEAQIYAAKLVVASVPAGVVGVLFEDWLTAQFADPIQNGVTLILSGFMVYSTKWTSARATASAPTWWGAFWIGCAQAVAILPGISRSGSTIALAIAIGVAPAVAAEFSFLMGSIAIAGAAVLMLPELNQAAHGAGAVAIASGSLASLLAGLASILIFVRMVDRSLFHVWAWYCWAVGGAFLVYVLMH